MQCNEIGNIFLNQANDSDISGIIFECGFKVVEIGKIVKLNFEFSFGGGNLENQIANVLFSNVGSNLR